MMLDDLNAIFVHVPKTAGNFLTRDYLSRYSNDNLIAIGHQDGINRFEIRGEVTTHKHMTLAEYAGAVDLRDTYVITTVRDPVERLVSGYFSPHRRFRLRPWARLISRLAGLLKFDARIGRDAYREEEITMEPQAFREFVHEQLSYRDYLHGYAEAKGLFLLRKESSLQDLNAVLQCLGRSPFNLQERFQFVNKADYRLSASQQVYCRQIVMDSRHAADYEYVEQLQKDAIDLGQTE